MNNSYARARTADLVISELPDEVLVYDLKTHQAHCLNQLAALIWRHCDGKSSVAQITQRIEVEERTLLEENAVWAALEQLSLNNLLVEAVKRPGDAPSFSRRRAMKKMGLGAALSIPLVLSVSAPTAAQAATCTCSVTTCIPLNGSSTCPAGCGGCLGTCYSNGTCGGTATSNVTCAVCDCTTSNCSWTKNP